ncbi:MAG: type II secretion system protein GspG [Planctomycetes bacterium]|nr:type II secretion system protein GspG [Planctomycetota bacterium]
MDPRRFRKALIVYAVLGVVAVTGWQVWRYGDDQSLRRTAERNAEIIERDFRHLRAAVSRFVQDRTRAPHSWDELCPMEGGYLDRVPEDPWRGRPYRFFESEGWFEAYSYGRDGSPGGDGAESDLFSGRDRTERVPPDQR